MTNLRRRFNKLGVSQDTLAEMAGVSQSSVSNALDAKSGKLVLKEVRSAVRRLENHQLPVVGDISQPSRPSRFEEILVISVFLIGVCIFMYVVWNAQ